MKSGLLSVSLTRSFAAHSQEYSRQETRTCRTWADATNVLKEWAVDPATYRSEYRGVAVRPRWRNGLVLHVEYFDAADSLECSGVGTAIEQRIGADYAGRLGERKRSGKASMARECLARCAFRDGEEKDAGDDARAFDAAKRALETCFPDTAALYVERIRTWMLAGGGVS